MSGLKHNFRNAIRVPTWFRTSCALCAMSTYVVHHYFDVAYYSTAVLKFLVVRQKSSFKDYQISQGQQCLKHIYTVGKCTHTSTQVIIMIRISRFCYQWIHLNEAKARGSPRYSPQLTNMVQKCTKFPHVHGGYTHGKQSTEARPYARPKACRERIPYKSFSPVLTTE